MKLFFLSFITGLLSFHSLSAEAPTLAKARAAGLAQSQYLSPSDLKSTPSELTADLIGFKKTIYPLLSDSCLPCHGPEKEKGDFRIDELNPDLVNGPDADWWVDVVGALTSNEMPPPEDEIQLSQKDRTQIIEWLNSQIHIASIVQKGESSHSSFRRLSNYELNYALQDLLGISQDLSKLLPQDASSAEGFRNSSDILQLTSPQFATYREAARHALQTAAKWGPRPDPVYYSITMDKAGPAYETWVRNHFATITEKKLNRKTGTSYRRHFPYGYSLWKPNLGKPTPPKAQDHVMVLEHRSSHQVDLGNYLPDEGTLQIRVRAERTSTGESYPSLRLSFGARTSNSGQDEAVVSQKDIAITAAPGKPEFYQWQVSLRDLERNPYLHTNELGIRPNPSEYIILHNVHQDSAKAEEATIHIDYIEITAAGDEQWPPASYAQVFPHEIKSLKNDEEKARHILTQFMPKAWRRAVTEEEVTTRLKLFHSMHATLGNFEESMIEVLASILSSPHFLYLSQKEQPNTDYELASRLSFFLWSSQPDEHLLKVASKGKLRDPAILKEQSERMLADPRAQRLARNFTHQWLRLEGLDFLQVDQKSFPHFSSELKASMKEEPLVFFHHLLTENHSILDFLHADYTFLNQNLALFYGLDQVSGNHFRRIPLPSESKRGGLLTQAGILAMNSDGKSSNPLKRGVWLLENILHDPPPPAPPAVPEIDLSDPRILQMTLKERMEDHRNKPACYSCHAKIDPWGIALEEFDALGQWRDQINEQAVDASSTLSNGSPLQGIHGLKKYLLSNRQDQFTQAMVHKLASYALGRPLGFTDHAELESITRELRNKGDGLRTLIHLLVTSDLFNRNSKE